MNASRLREIVQVMLTRERELNLQTAWNDLNTCLANLASNPQAQQHQTQVATALEQLSSALEKAKALFEPAQIKSIQDMNAQKFFLPDKAREIRIAIQENPMTSAVVSEIVSKLTSEREKFIKDLDLLDEKLARFGIHTSSLQPWHS